MPRDTACSLKRMPVLSPVYIVSDSKDTLKRTLTYSAWWKLRQQRSSKARESGENEVGGKMTR